MRRGRFTEEQVRNLMPEVYDGLVEWTDALRTMAALAGDILDGRATFIDPRRQCLVEYRPPPPPTWIWPDR